MLNLTGKSGTLAVAAFAAASLLFTDHALSGEPETPFRVSTDLFDFEQPHSLGLAKAPGTETITVYRPGDGEGHYNHGVVLFPFRGKLYAQWQSSLKDEDSPDTHVLYAVSPDGKQWSRPERLLGSAKSRTAHSNGGWWSDGETLVAYVVRWQVPTAGVRSGVTEAMTSQEGRNWSALRPVLDHRGKAIEGVIEQDPHSLPGGRVISAFHRQPGLILAPAYTEDPLGLEGWQFGEFRNLPYEGDSSRELEPSWFLRRDGSVVMVMRDQAGSFRKLASISRDKGQTWSAPVVTDMPDSRSKQSAGNLPDGSAFLVGNPSGSKHRSPLAVVLSRDGNVFDRAFLLRGDADLQPQRAEGRYKRAGFSYPKSLVWDGFLYVAYATNKEDVELSRVPLTSLQSRPTESGAPP